MNADVIKKVGVLCLLSMLSPSLAQTPGFYTQHAIGWHWYDDPTFDESSEREEKEEKRGDASSLDPVTQIKSVRQALEMALDDAILHPSVQKVAHYITLQNAWSEQASLFSRMWQWVLLQRPQLDYSIRHPTNQVGRTVYLDKVTGSEETAIKTLAQQNGLFFFYRGQCPYCRRFAPIVKSFSERYQMPVIAITLDGRLLPEFPRSVKDQGQAQHFQVQLVPALFTVNPYTHQAIPLSWGLTSENDLRRHILEVAITSGRIGP